MVITTKVLLHQHSVNSRSRIGIDTHMVLEPCTAIDCNDKMLFTNICRKTCIPYEMIWSKNYIPTN